MFDTVCIKCFISLSQAQLVGWIFHGNRRRAETSGKYTYTVNKRKPNRITFTYIPHPYYGPPFILVEFSIPRFIYGSNLYMVTDVDGAISEIQDYIDNLPDVPKVDLHSGELFRVDLCYNFYCGELVPDYKKSLSTLPYPNRDTVNYRKGGVEFPTKTRGKTKIYPQQARLGKKAHGNFRLEVTLRDEEIGLALGVPKPTIADVTPMRYYQILNAELEKLNLLGNNILNRDTALQVFVDTFGAAVGLRFLQLLEGYIKYGKAGLAAKLHKTERSVERQLDQIRKAGIPLTLTDYIEPLPPLVISPEYIKKLSESS